MGRGGSRAGAGRRKQERPTNVNVATRVLAEARAERLWMSIIELERLRLGINQDSELNLSDERIPKADLAGKYSVKNLIETLKYLEDRAFGRPMDMVNHLHERPIELNAKISLAETISRARKRVAGA
jgi:hypothetical protein